MNKTKSNYAENWLPVKNINNGMIELDNKQFVTGVKIIPRNIFILDQNTQDNIILALKNFYNTLDFEYWLMSVELLNLCFEVSSSNSFSFSHTLLKVVFKYGLP